MSIPHNIAWGILAGMMTKVARAVTLRAMHTDGGVPRLPPAVRERSGLAMMLAWAAATGVLLALVEILREQRRDTIRLG